MPLDLQLTPDAVAELRRFVLLSEKSTHSQLVGAFVFCLRPPSEGGETEIAGRTGFWDVGAYERVSVAPGNLFRVGEIELAWEDTAYSRALLGCTIDFVQGKWRVLEAGA